MPYGKRIIGTISYMGGVIAIPEEFCYSWGQMIQYNSEYLCQPGEIIWQDRAKISWHSAARNSLAERMKGDWLWMTDTDHQFDPDIVCRLVNLMSKYQVDVLTGVYVYKHPPHFPLLYQYIPYSDMFDMIVDWEIPDPSCEIFEIGASGAGCLLVKRDVFHKIRNELHESPFDIIPPKSEDLSFFRRLHTLGVKSYVAPLIESHHLAIYSSSLSDRKLDGLGEKVYHEVLAHKQE